MSPSIPGNVILKGVQSFELNALIFLRECNYNINLAMRKILFPVVDMLDDTSDAGNLNDKAIQTSSKNFY